MLFFGLACVLHPPGWRYLQTRCLTFVVASATPKSFLPASFTPKRAIHATLLLSSVQRDTDFALDKWREFTGWFYFFRHSCIVPWAHVPGNSRLFERVSYFSCSWYPEVTMSVSRDAARGGGACKKYYESDSTVAKLQTVVTYLQKHHSSDVDNETLTPSSLASIISKLWENT